MNENGTEFAFANGSRLTFRLEDYSPSFLPVAHIDDHDMPTEGEIYHNMTVVDDANKNLTNNEKELLRWHYKIGHFDMSTIQGTMRTGRNEEPPIIKPSFSGASSVKHPICSSCQLGKQ